MKYEVALLDIDGTLRHRNIWNPGALELIAHLHSAGIHVALCSGRSTGSMIGLAEELPGLDYLASSSGATVLTRENDEWRVVSHRPLPANAVEKALQVAEGEGIELWGYTAREWLVSAHSRRSDLESSFVGDEARVTRIAEHSERIGKILFLPGSEAQQRAVKELNDVPGTTVVMSGPRYADLISTEAHYAKGGDVIVDALGVSWDRVIAMGDSENDRGLLAMAGLAVCIPPMFAAHLQDVEGAGAPDGKVRLDARDTRHAHELLVDHLAGGGSAR